MPTTDKLTALLDKLLLDGTFLVTPFKMPGPLGEETDNSEEIRHWSNELALFKSLAGDLVNPWQDKLITDERELIRFGINTPYSALETIRYAMTQGLLTRFEDLVVADTFADLNEQAKHLLEQNYFLAAGVICRAVLEEKLRKLCDRNGCTPTKSKGMPTINDYNMALYGRQPAVYDKTEMHQVTSMAAIGSDAAHNEPNLTRDKVESLFADLQAFLARHSVQNS
ncbi:MAG TPA: hypothetical protein VIW47_05285 [Nitrospiraceae bacterium]|jgi:hypothetical protein